MKTRVIDAYQKHLINMHAPFYVAVTLTNLCNFRCKHCAFQSLRDDDADSIDLDLWNEILLQLYNKGTRFLKITGGEPLCSDIFLSFYRKAYDIGFKIKLLTNMSMISQEHLELFAQCRPYEIQGSLYGMSTAVYKDFCGYCGNFEDILEHVMQLKQYKLPLKLQTVLNTFNFDNLIAMNEFAIQYDIPLTAHQNIKCEVDGNERPLEYSISVEQKMEASKIMNEIYENIINDNKLRWIDHYKNCYAGLISCNINNKGDMFLCQNTISNALSIIKHGVDYCWNHLEYMYYSKIAIETTCSNCIHKLFCGQCALSAPTLEKNQSLSDLKCYKEATIIRTHVNI